MEYDDPGACRDPQCVWLFPHKADDACRPQPVTLADVMLDAGLNADDDPGLL